MHQVVTRRSPQSPAMPQATHTPHVPRDILYHLGYPLPESTADLTARLRAVQYVLLCGTASRARSLAAAVAPGPHDDICRTDRYTVLVPAPHVVVAAHGIGTGSVDCLLHELVKALRVAGAEGYAFIRVGSCGGVGIAPGGVVVSGAVLNGVFAPVLNMCVLGKVVEMPAVLDASLRAKLLEFGKGLFGDGAVVQGDTMSAETFYTAQGRLDGAFCDFGRTERAAFLEKCRSRGIRNFEMEVRCTAFHTERFLCC